MDTEENTVQKRTGVIYDEMMTGHKCEWDPNYPECPERFTEILKRCSELGLISRCVRLDARKAEVSELLTKHTIEHISTLEATEMCNDVSRLESLSSLYDSVYINQSTYNSSLLAAGCAINLVNAICNGIVQNGMAIIRPPGHHAMNSDFCGFCFFNNVALAAEHALNTFGLIRILIVDFDVHHGQATQQMFYDDPRVVYFSIHRYEHGTFWPNLRQSDYDFIGEACGEGYNFNVPLNTTGLGNNEYLAIFHQLLLPLVVEYQPQLIIISAGYDAAIGCPEFNPQLILVSAGYDAAVGDRKGKMEVTPACYAHLVTSLSGFANGKIAVILEGGYCLRSLAEGAALTMRALLGDPCPNIEHTSKPHESVCNTILNVIYTHRNSWQCYQYQEFFSKNSKTKRYHRHIPTIKFDHDEIYPTVFETRNCHEVNSKEYNDDCNAKIDRLILGTRLLSPANKVCFVYDEIMLGHKNLLEPNYPEKPERISAIYDRFTKLQLLDRIHRLSSRRASQEELLAVHSERYINGIIALQSSTADENIKYASKFSSVYFNQQTTDAAFFASGSLLQVVDSVLNGESATGVAVIRPPGHHANEEEACGFCIFNNIAVAAKYAINAHGLKRVLIFDWDVHHGNGTQQIFESDPQVLYISIHRYEKGTFFPGNPKQASHTFVGEGAGTGFTINIPWNNKRMGDGEYIAAIQQIVLPVAYQFNPELVLVSAGFDALQGDPLGGYDVSPEAYAHFTHWLMPLANGRLILSLEGGYNTRLTAIALSLCTKALLSDPLPNLVVDPVKKDAATSIKNVIDVQRAFWTSLCFLVEIPNYEVLSCNSDRVTNNVRSSTPMKYLNQ